MCLSFGYGGGEEGVGDEIDWGGVHRQGFGRGVEEWGGGRQRARLIGP